MTNHDDTPGPGERGREDHGSAAGDHPAHGSAHLARSPGPAARLIDCPDFGDPIKLRSAAELADALPYILGFRPEDIVVLLALHRQQGHSRFGGRVRVGIPSHPADWQAAADELARSLVIGSRLRGCRADAVIAFVCREPARDGAGRQVVEELRPLAGALRRACGTLGVPVVEALCLSGGSFWSFCCPDDRCCPPEGLPMGLPGSSVLAAAAAYAGIRVRGTLKDLRTRFAPWQGGAARAQEAALDLARAALMPPGDDRTGRPEVSEATLARARGAVSRFCAAPVAPDPAAADRADDALLGHEEAAALLIGLQDRSTRDRAAEWMEGPEALGALRLWRTLARRCVGPYAHHAAAPLALAGWVAWSTGDDLEAREALAMSLAADPDYLFARLLHKACNDGLSPETVRECIRREGGRSRTAGPAEAAHGPLPGVTAPVLPRSARTGAALRRAKARQRASGGARGPLPSGPPARPKSRPRPTARPRPVPRTGPDRAAGPGDDRSE
ncbi:DUF4192 domain-containing protein [Streptomyces sp. NPDC049906]|uniref:DUF4192 domain-containing protein n=1 Tax=Streptomyces sp. NPDC049906 TaxID=3155656 RepID=UPI00343FF55F